MSEQTEPRTPGAPTDSVAGRGEAAERVPYEPPRLVSGPAFENVLLASTCGNNYSVFEGCTDPCN